MSGDFPVMRFDNIMLINTEFTKLELQNVFTKIKGHLIRATWKGYGSTIFIESGRLKKEMGSNHHRGEYSFMIEPDWEMFNGKLVFVSSRSNYDRIHDILSAMLGKRIREVRIVGFYRPTLTIKLNNGFILKVKSNKSQDEASWSLKIPDGKWLGGLKNGFEQQENI